MTLPQWFALPLPGAAWRYPFLLAPGRVEAATLRRCCVVLGLAFTQCLYLRAHLCTYSTGENYFLTVLHKAYMHVGMGWLVGGGSNTGGAALKKYFSSDELHALSQKIDPETESGLKYYPLPRTGERFPVCDPHKEPVLEPRPEDNSLFLHGARQYMHGTHLWYFMFSMPAGLSEPALLLLQSLEL